MTKKKTKTSTKSSQVKVVPIKKGDPDQIVENSPPTINTAIEAVKEYAVQLKGRAEDGRVRGALIIEFGVDPKDSGLRQAGAVSKQEAAIAALMIQKMVMDGPVSSV